MEPLGVYIHFPFCLRKCPYCDFVSFEARDRSVDAAPKPQRLFGTLPDDRDDPAEHAPPVPHIDHAGYADAVIAELERRRVAFEGRRLETVFFGGGTPSLWAPSQLGRVLSAILAAAPTRASNVEITVECNPSSLDENRATELRAIGVNRLSVGVQSVNDARLRFLGRLHSANEGVRAVQAAMRSGMPRVSADLIYGVETDVDSASAEASAREAEAIADLGVTHLSAYSLTIEPRTRFGELHRRGTLPIATDEVLARSYFAVERALAARGFVHYEISNFAQPGAESRHNLLYWRGADYLGLGCAAVGTLSGAGGKAVRYKNPTRPEAYVAMTAQLATGGATKSEVRGVLAGDSDTEPLFPEVRLRERIMLGLRLLEGFDLEGAAEALGASAWPTARRRAADKLVSAGRLIVEGGRLRVPPAARIFSDGIAVELF